MQGGRLPANTDVRGIGLGQVAVLDLGQELAEVLGVATQQPPCGPRRYLDSQERDCGKVVSRELVRVSRARAQAVPAVEPGTGVEGAQRGPRALLVALSSGTPALGHRPQAPAVQSASGNSFRHESSSKRRRSEPERRSPSEKEKAEYRGGLWDRFRCPAG